MKRVVITGIGIISSIGNNKETVLLSLKKQNSGIIFSKEMKEFGIKSNVWGKVNQKIVHNIKRNILRFMNYTSLYAYCAMEQAIIDAFLDKCIYQRNNRVGLIVGSGNGYLKQKNKFNPYLSIQSMNSNVSACLSTIYKIYGVSYSISSACATSASCIGHAYELIQFGKQDIIFSGGSEELNCELAFRFDMMHALSKKYNCCPQSASRPYDINRDGFVISEGSGILVLEELSHALSRNARIYAEIVGLGMNSNGKHMFIPSQDGYKRVMNMALKKIKNTSIEYVNSHATSTKIGDIVELKAIQEVFKNCSPYISSTKSLTGHSLGASGVHEIIYVILMMQNNFIVSNMNIFYLDDFSQNMNLVLHQKTCKFSIAMSNSFGFGGVNVSIILQKYF